MKARDKVHYSTPLRPHSLKGRDSTHLDEASCIVSKEICKSKTVPCRYLQLALHTCFHEFERCNLRPFGWGYFFVDM
jgi:hypothetical protein